MRQWIRYNQIAHYLMNRSDFEIKIVQKIECLICISKGSLLLKHPVQTIQFYDFIFGNLNGLASLQMFYKTPIFHFKFLTGFLLL